MADLDPWAGMIDPRAALKAAREAAKTLASSSQHQAGSGESNSFDKTTSCDSFSHFSHSSQASQKLSPPSHSAAKDRKETCSSSLSITYEHSASPAGLLAPGREWLGDSAPAKVANRLKSQLTHSDISIIALATPGESFAVTNTVPSPTAHLSGPLAWRDGLARLDRWTPPCEGFRSGEWEDIHRTVSHFMDHCAAEAAARGWSALDLFGVHHAAGSAAVDSCGALMLPGGGVVTSVSADALAFGHLVYRKRVMPQAVLVWDFRGEAA